MTTRHITHHTPPSDPLIAPDRRAFFSLSASLVGPFIASNLTAQESPSSPVTHSIFQAGVPRVSQNAIFRLEHPNLSEREAALYLQEAERIAYSVAAKFLPGGLPSYCDPRRGGRRIDITFYSSSDEYLRATGLTRETPAMSQIDFRRGTADVIRARVSIHQDNARNHLSQLLPHEVTHVILAELIPGKVAPRWIDEGLACLSEDRETIGRYIHRALQALRTNTILSTQYVMERSEYPEPNARELFYSQSVALTSFLLSLGKASQFVCFAHHALSHGSSYEQALGRYYAISTYAACDIAFRRWLTTQSR